jgi:maltose alpha-D-glucosyltransferase / alpha-amylase
MSAIPKIEMLWHQLYDENHNDALNEFIACLNEWKDSRIIKRQEPEWYKDVIVYSLYVDHFNKDFSGLTEKLDYLEYLGVNCLWLLPVLDSPMRDAGFDIRDYSQIRHELLGLPENAAAEEKRAAFAAFLSNAHERGIKVIFDIAVNHTSEEHPWFVEAKKGEDNPYRDYYIWRKDTSLYKDARIIFKGLEQSNWEKDGEWYYFHRFFNFQPDLNYRNPKVLTEMTKNLLFWIGEGVDGFRVDAIPYLWKEDGTNCENLPQTHTIVKFFRAVTDYVRPNTLLLAEACQKPAEVVKYFGDGDECHAGYHFPMMPQMFKAIAMESREPIIKTLGSNNTPEIPEAAQWFTFLRCHDELSLELVYVSEEDRAYLHSRYCHNPAWDFRQGEGISARLSELMQRNPDKIALAFSVMLTLPGTPIIYYGDEFGKFNEEGFYREKINETGKDDTRFLVRGKIDWQQLEDDLKNEISLPAKIYERVRKMVRFRKKFNVFGRGSIVWIDAKKPEGAVNRAILAYLRKWQNRQLLIVQNLSSQPQTCRLKFQPEIVWTDIFGKQGSYDETSQTLSMQPWEYLWLEV